MSRRQIFYITRNLEFAEINDSESKTASDLIEDAETIRKLQQFDKNLKREKRSSLEAQEEKQVKSNKQDGSFLRAAGSSSEKESDDIFSSVEEQMNSGEFCVVKKKKKIAFKIQRMIRMIKET